MTSTAILVAAAILLVTPAGARTISINLYNSAGSAENNPLEAGDLAGVIPVDGEHWNNIGFASGRSPSPPVSRLPPAKKAVSTLGKSAFASSTRSRWRSSRCSRHGFPPPLPFSNFFRHTFGFRLK